jgi:addiction module RelB/DinJ family antitoxin
MNTNINIRTTNELKANANQVLQRMGLDMSTAVNIFLNQVVYKNAIPFEISAPARKIAHLGGWEGKVTISADFNEPMEEFEDYTR